jgi:hypothetical protein
MNYLVSLIKIAIKWTPKMMILWVANYKLKGIAEVKDFNLDLDARKVYVHTQLFGEADSIEVWAENFAIIIDQDTYKFILQLAKSNKPWLSNTFALIVGKAWPIPKIPQLAPFMPLAYALLKAESPVQKISGYIDGDS